MNKTEYSIKKPNRTTDRYIATCKFKWNPQERTAGTFSIIRPDMDGCLTPRSAKKVTRLDRTFDRDLWFPSNGRTDFISSKYRDGPSLSVEKDIEKGNYIKKLQRKKRMQ